MKTRGGLDFVSYLAIAVIFISLASIGVQLTGRVTDTAIVNVTVASSALINFTTDYLDWGSGTVTSGSSGAWLNTTGAGSVGGGSWTPNAAQLVLENIGNVNVTLNISSNRAADAYLGGTSPLFQYKISEVETDACVNASAASFTSFTTTPTQICERLQYYDSKDAINVDILLYVPSDSLTGSLNNTITATGTAV